MQELTHGKGSALTSKCPRAGIAWLSTGNALYSVETSCKSWRCLSCRDRKLGMVATIIQSGLLDTVAYLLSVTFASNFETNGKLANPVNADYAETSFKEFLRRWRRSEKFLNPTLQWFKVPELTKKGQVHFHLVITGILDTRFKQGTCSLRPNWLKLYHKRHTCLCMRCHLSLIWEQVTNDSYIIDVRRVYDQKGAAWYLCKYLRKGMYGQIRDQLESRGFIRRYSRSNGYTAMRPMKRLGTLHKAWTRTAFSLGSGDRQHLQWSNTQPLMRQIGTNPFKQSQLFAKLAKLNKELT